MLALINILYAMCRHSIENSNNTKCKNHNRTLIGMEAQAYFNNLKSEGYDDESALVHTHRFYPEFSLVTANTLGNMDTSEWINQNFQRIAAECYPDDEGAIFTIASITNNGEFIEVVANSNPSIGYDPVRYDFILINGIPTLESTYTPEPDGSWIPFFSTGNSNPQPTPVTVTPTTQSNSVYQAPQQVQNPQSQQMMDQYAPQQPMMQGQPMQAYSQNPSMMNSPSTNAILALVLSIIGIVTILFYGIGLFFAIPGLILANGSLRITNQFPNHPDAGIAKTAKVCAWISIGLFIAVMGLMFLAGLLYVWAASL
jgi:hypothetical protein